MKTELPLLLAWLALHQVPPAVADEVANAPVTAVPIGSAANWFPPENYPAAANFFWSRRHKAY